MKRQIKKLVSKVNEWIIERNMSATSRLISTAILHQKTFGPYKNFCKGSRDIVICGAGPSLNDYKPIGGGQFILR